MSKTNTQIGIIGNGYVGKSIQEFFDSRVNIVIYDTCFTSYSKHLSSNNKLTYFTNRFTDILDSDFIFICVPTPEGENGACDYSIVLSYLERLHSIGYKGIVIIKSTIPVGFTRNFRSGSNLNVIFSPEFAGENKYWSKHAFLKSLKDSPFFIFGGDLALTNKAVQLFQSIGGPEKKYIQCDSSEAEMMKLMNNSFFALKVAFCNEMYDVCKNRGINYSSVRELWLLDPRNSPDFTLVFENDRGFGGKCLPKDTASLINIAKKDGAPSLVLEAAIESNKKNRKD